MLGGGGSMQGLIPQRRGGGAPQHGPCGVLVSKINRRTFLGDRKRIIDARARPLANAINNWLIRFGRFEAARARRELREHGLTKADKYQTLEDELLDLLLKYGLTQYTEAARDASGNPRTIIRPEVRARILRVLEMKVRLTVRNTADDVRDSLSRLLTEAMEEVPQPSVAEIGRRIARQYHGPADSRESLFSFERAYMIARTEIATADNAGMAQGYEDSGVERVRWLARSDGRSGERHHERMNSHKPIAVVDMMGNDDAKWFELPSGERTPYPAWDGLPVGERVNCRCGIIPA